MAVRNLVTLFIAVQLFGLHQCSRPNIVMIIADDLGWSDLGFHSGDMRSPNIDALAYNGIILKRHISQPLCTPSRSALLTGDYPMRHGMQGEPCLPRVADGLPLNLTLLPEYMRDLGYQTHLVGKWHLGYETKAHLPTRRGFDTFYGYLNGYLGAWDGTHYFKGEVGRDFRDGEEGAWRDVYGRYLTEVLTERAVNIIENKTVDDNFFMILSENAVHATSLPMAREAPPTTTNFTNRGILREMVNQLDWSVGEVVSALERKGLLDNTVLVFISDNGAPTTRTMFANSGSNWPFRGQKASPHEGGVRTAGIVYSPLLVYDIPRVTEQIVHISDWFPTLLAIAGANERDLLPTDGINQWPSLFNATEGPRKEALVDIDEANRSEAYVKGQWKLIKNSNPNADSAVNDRFHGITNHWMEYDIEEVKNSKVGKIIGQIPENWADLKSQVKVAGSCPNRQAAEDYDCHTKYCLFDVLTDPSECKDQAANYASILAELTSTIDAYRQVLVPHPPKVKNSAAEPKYFEDYWSPWEGPL